MTAIKTMNIGIVGCGNIAGKAYVPACRKFPFLHIAACADLDVARAEEFAKQHQIPRGVSVDALLADPTIELVINLTVPKAHAPLDLRCLEAGKHVFSEKPFAISREEGEAVVALAKKKGLRVGCAPDTVMGCGVQTCRKYLDEGLIGQVVAGNAFMLCGGHETWHPSPEFYYEAGGGPLYDMGPYYLHALITLLGPVQRVCGVTKATWPTRTITSQPKKGKVVQVEVPTHLVTVLEFAQGAVVTLTTSFDIKGGHTMPNIELYGTEGSMQVPDPNGTNGAIRIARRGVHDWTEYARTHPYRDGSRGVGVADMALAIRNGRAHRTNEAIAMHAVDVFQAVHEASAGGRYVTLTSTCERPAAMRADLPDWTLDP
jgi:predicted dehydrogenase